MPRTTKSYKRSRDLMLQVMADDLVSPKEALRHLAFWLVAEYNILRAARAEYLAEKYIKKLNEDVAVFRLRHQMKDS